MIQKPLILILAISTLFGLSAAQSVESWSWGQIFFLGFCYGLFRMWLIYKDNGLELNFSISLATSFAGFIIQEQKTSNFINFSYPKQLIHT